VSPDSTRHRCTPPPRPSPPRPHPSPPASRRSAPPSSSSAAAATSSSPKRWTTPRLRGDVDLIALAGRPPLLHRGQDPHRPRPYPAEFRRPMTTSAACCGNLARGLPGGPFPERERPTIPIASDVVSVYSVGDANRVRPVFQTPSARADSPRAGHSNPLRRSNPPDSVSAKNREDRRHGRAGMHPSSTRQGRSATTLFLVGRARSIVRHHR